jgi:hypothetical protein
MLVLRKTYENVTYVTCLTNLGDTSRSPFHLSIDITASHERKLPAKHTSYLAPIPAAGRLWYILNKRDGATWHHHMQVRGKEEVIHILRGFT